jgi:ferredoxin
MPNNVCNFALLGKTSDRKVRKLLKKAGSKMDRVCRDIRGGVMKRRGFSTLSRILGKAQGIPWQGDSRNAFASKNTLEFKSKHGVKIGRDCNACSACVEKCPMRNLENRQGAIAYHNNCTACYRCVNLCQQRAITVFFHRKPRWQYGGIGMV